MSRLDYTTYHRLERRVRILWWLLLLAAFTWLPVLLLLPLGHLWRAGAQRTVFASHVRGVVRLGWIVLLLPLIVFPIPSLPLAIGILVLGMLAIAWMAIAGLRESGRGDRYTGLLA